MSTENSVEVTRLALCPTEFTAMFNNGEAAVGALVCPAFRAWLQRNKAAKELTIKFDGCPNSTLRLIAVTDWRKFGSQTTKLVVTGRNFNDTLHDIIAGFDEVTSFECTAAKNCDALPRFTMVLPLKLETLWFDLRYVAPSYISFGETVDELYRFYFESQRSKAPFLKELILVSYEIGPVSAIRDNLYKVAKMLKESDSIASLIFLTPVVISVYRELASIGFSSGAPSDFTTDIGIEHLRIYNGTVLNGKKIRLGLIDGTKLRYMKDEMDYGNWQPNIIYLSIFLYPPCLITCFLSMFMALYYLIHHRYGENIHIIVPMILGFNAQVFRVGLLIILLERITASVFVKHYNNNSNFGLAFMILLSGILTVGYLIPLTLLVPYQKTLQMFTTYFVLATHMVTLVICKLLYFINRKAYKHLAYRVTLRERYQILENVKVLKFVYPTILIFALIAPLSPLMIFITSLVFKSTTSPSLFHLSYNLAFIVMMGYRISKVIQERKKKLKPGPEYVVAVISPLGKELPANQAIDSYFENLQRQWKTIG